MHTQTVNGKSTRTFKTRSKPARQYRTKMEVEVISEEVLANWKVPGFQRPITINAKLTAVSEHIKANSGTIPGTLTIGVFDNEFYRVDGQHRIKAFEITGLKEGLADVKYVYFDTYEEMAAEFDALNSPIARMKPDDHLRAIEQTNPALHQLKKACPFIGYGTINRGRGTTVISMSVVLRAWSGSSTDTPVATGPTTQMLGNSLTSEDAEMITDFLKLALDAWGKDAVYGRLWTGMNMTLCMWLYRQVVLQKAKDLYKVTKVTEGEKTRTKTTASKVTFLTREQFKEGLMSLSTTTNYVQWLMNRPLNEVNRGPCYDRIKKLFQARLTTIIGKKAHLPVPAWNVR